VIEVRALEKRYGSAHILRDVAFDVPAGSLCGFIGPNGAGKTTTMRILATLDAPTSGTVKVFGLDAQREPVALRNIIGYMPDYYGTYENLIVAEYLEFFARAFQLKGAVRLQRTSDVVEFTELGPLLGRAVEVLSKGQKQRLSLARALLSDPKVLIMDEPAAGLDPRARVELRELLKVLAARGKTVFISSHILSELADFIDWVVIIDRGRIRHAGPPELARTQRSTTSYDLELASDETSTRRFLLEQPGVIACDGGEGVLRLDLDEEVEKIEELLARMVLAGLRFRQVQRHKADLEDVFMSVTNRRSDDPPR
jgi:ABC-2 type transport system ATP-binding protein